MTTTAKLGLTHLVNKQANAEVPLNTDLAILDSFAILRIISTTNTPPGSPAVGDTYIVGAAGTGVWSGHNNQIATWTGAWAFVTPKSGVFAYDQSSGESMGYSELGAAFTTPSTPWFPLQPRWNATEHWTGQFHGGIGANNRVWSKTLSMVLPNATTTTTAHSITNLDLTATSLMTIESHAAQTASPTTGWFFNMLSASSLLQWNINATNVLAISSQNLSTYTALIRLAYRRTGTS